MYFATGEDVTMRVYTYGGLCSIASITIDGVNRTNEIINNNNTYVFSNISANHTVVIEFEKQASNKINVDFNYQDIAYLSFSDNDGYSVGTYSSGFVVLPSGGEVKMSLNILSSAYQLNKVSVDGVDVTTQINNGQYVFNNLSADHNVSVVLDKLENTNSISVNFNEGFSSSFYFEDDGKTLWNHQNADFATGHDVKLFIRPSFGIVVNKLFVTNTSTNIKTDVTESYQANGYYEFSNLSADYAVEVELDDVGVSMIYVDYDPSKADASLLTYSVDPKSGTGYVINSYGNEFTKGSNVRLYVSPYEGYALESILVDNTDVTSTYLENNYYEIPNLNANHSIKVIFKESVPVTISFVCSHEHAADFHVSWPNNSCYIYGNRSLEVAEGSNVQMSLNGINELYTISTIKIDESYINVESFINNGYTISNVTTDHTVYIDFGTVLTTNNVSVTLDQQDLVEVSFGSYIDGNTYYSYTNQSGIVAVPNGVDVDMAIRLLQSPYQITKILVGGNDVTLDCTFSDGYYRYLIPTVSNDFNVTVEFEPVASNTISVSYPDGFYPSIYYEDGFTTTYESPAELASGRDVKMYIEPNVGSVISSVIISDGTNSQDVTSTFQANGGYYVFPSLSKNYTVEVGLEVVNTHTIKVNFDNSLGWVYLNDSWIGSGNENEYNEGSTVRLTADAFQRTNEVKSILIDGTTDVISEFRANDGYYEFTNLLTDHNVFVSFGAKPTVTVTFDNSQGGVSLNYGSIDSDIPNPFVTGSTVRISPDANDGFRVSSVTVDGSAVSLTDGYYEFTLTDNCTVVVNFVEAAHYSITVTGDFEHGSYWLDNDNPKEGSNVSLTIEPDEGYIATIKEDGNELPLTFAPSCSTGNYTYVFENIQASHDVKVEFEWKDLSRVTFVFNSSQIEYVRFNGCWAFENTNDCADVTTGTTVNMEIYPSIGYEVESVKAGGTQLTGSFKDEGYYYYEFVASPCTVTITMKKKAAPLTVSFTLPASGERTYCSEYDLNFRNVSGIKAYVASGFDPTNGQLVLTRVDEAPAGTGLLIKGTAGEYSIPTTNSNFLFANMMRGVVKNTDIPVTNWYHGWYGSCNYTNYIFGTDGKFRTTDGEELPANSAYLILPTIFVENSSLAKIGLIFLDDEEEVGGITTGVGFIWAGEKRTITTDDAIYNLQGQKVTEKSLKPGIYIKNGKKFMVK